MQTGPHCDASTTGLGRLYYTKCRKAGQTRQKCNPSRFGSLVFSRTYLVAEALLTRAKLRILPAKMETTMKCTELIMQDHTILRRGLDILDGMGKKLDDGERIELADATTLLPFFRVFGEYHQNMVNPTISKINTTTIRKIFFMMHSFCARDQHWCDLQCSWSGPTG